MDASDEESEGQRSAMSHHSPLIENSSSTRSDLEEESNGGLSGIRLFLSGVLLGVIIFVIYDSFGPGLVHQSVLRFLSWVETHKLEGALAVIGVYIVATVCFVPSTILTLGTGYAFGAASESKLQGVMVSFGVAFTGASLGTICTFLFGRYLFRDCVSRMASKYPMFKAIDRALTQNGLKIMMLLRLSPVVPWNALDYLSGLTAVPLWVYSAALIGSVPGTIMLCFLGASASSLADTSSRKDKVMDIVTLVSGVVFAGAGLFVASYYSKLELDRILEEEQEEVDLSLPERNVEDGSVSTSSSAPYRDAIDTDDASTGEII